MMATGHTSKYPYGGAVVADEPADVPASGGGRLTDAEIRDLAERFSAPEQATRVLAAAGLPLGAQPYPDVCATVVPERLRHDRKIHVVVPNGATKDLIQ
jgi:hypothetical protein